MKHITDHPKTRDSAVRLAKFADLDRRTGDGPSSETETLSRSPRRRDSGEKLKRFAQIERQSD